MIHFRTKDVEGYVCFDENLTALHKYFLKGSGCFSDICCMPESFPCASDRWNEDAKHSYRDFVLSLAIQKCETVKGYKMQGIEPRCEINLVFCSDQRLAVEVWGKRERHGFLCSHNRCTSGKQGKSRGRDRKF